MAKLHASEISYSFGTKGAGMIAYSGLLLYFMTGLTVDGLNVIVPGFAAIKGWNADQLLSISTPAGIIALALASLWALVVKRIGAKNATTLGLALAAASTAAFALSVNVWMYAVTETLMVTFINCFAMIGGFTMIANWFPRKKGIVLGFATMGMNIASATIPVLLTVFSRVVTSNPDGDVTHALFIFAAILAVVGVFNHGVVKDNPEAAGAFPDNEPEEKGVIEAPSLTGDQAGLTYWQALRTPKILALGLVYGLSGMATVGIMSQIIVYLTSNRGFTQAGAISTLSLAAVIGVFGSWAFGVVDQRWGTKLATQCFGVWMALAIVALITPGQGFLYLAVFMVGMGIGGNGNFAPSMTAQVCGRHDFPSAYAVVLALSGIVRSAAFVVLAAVRSATGSADLAYILFACVSVSATVVVSLIRVRGQEEPLTAISVSGKESQN
ncbi:MAG: MFS transporter [Bifidobacteriaceae bacterium]|jgi:OFA family oxalate/formate antiporter-like MFS transporter|nr:MFS transporter [Bifidobacteriaceae bacterium]